MRARDFGERSALVASEALHFPESPRELGACFLQGDFRINVEETGEIDGDEEDVAKFALDTGGDFFGVGEDCAKFVGFFVEFVEDAVDGIPVEADAGGLAGELEGFEQRGEGVRDAVEDGW